MTREIKTCGVISRAIELRQTDGQGRSMHIIISLFFIWIVILHYDVSAGELKHYENISVAMGAGEAVRERERIIRKDDSGKEVTVRAGENIRIELKRYGGTGYDWHLEKSFEGHLSLVKEEDVEEAVGSRAIVGASIKKQWDLRAISPGETEVSIKLYRNWEGMDKAIDSFKLRIIILAQ